MVKIPCGREWLPTPVFLPGEYHGQRSLVCFSPWGHRESDTTEWLTLRKKQGHSTAQLRGALFTLRLCTALAPEAVQCSVRMALSELAKPEEPVPPLPFFLPLPPWCQGLRASNVWWWEFPAPAHELISFVMFLFPWVLNSVSLYYPVRYSLWFLIYVCLWWLWWSQTHYLQRAREGEDQLAEAKIPVDFKSLNPK